MQNPTDPPKCKVCGEPIIDKTRSKKCAVHRGLSTHGGQPRAAIYGLRP